VSYSTKVKEGDNVLIYKTEGGMDLATEIYRQASVLGANPFICYGGDPWDATPTELLRGYYESTPQEYLKNFPRHQYELVKASDVIIHIRSAQNTVSLTSIDPKKISLRTGALKELDEESMRKRWCITQYPTIGYAQQAEISLREYEDFVYSAILIDWEKEVERMSKIKEIMDNTDEVRIIGPKMDITMSIKGRITAIDKGEHNLPGGEAFTAPIEDSANGEVFFDLPAVRFGREVVGTRLKLNGMNTRITRFTKNLLFDEKICGTVHLAIGNAYKGCGGTNESAIHWDMIRTMKNGKIIMDGEVIQEDGKFKWE